jgi:hypothetical protein
VAEQSGGREPVYLTLEDILELFAAIIDGTPAEASNQLRSRDGLAGALARPATHAHYETPTSPSRRRSSPTASPRRSASGQNGGAPWPSE